MSRTPVKEVLHIAGIPLEEQLRIVMRERDELAHEVRQITRYQEVNGTAGVGSAWQQMGATTRELRRVEDELLVVKARNQQLEGSARQTSDLLETIARLESQSQRSDTLLAVLREELRESKHESHQLKEAHLASEQRLQRAKTESGGREESFKATIVERDLKIVELEIQIKTMASMASMKEIVSVPKTLQMIQPEVSSIAVEQLELEIRGLQTRLTESETQRRALLRKVQDLRGNVRVMVRLRPRLQGEGGEEDCIQCHPDGRSLQLHGDVRGAEQIFTLDQIFGSRSTQENIYQELNDLVQSAMDGYRICLLSYGQTGLYFFLC